MASVSSENKSLMPAHSVARLLLLLLKHEDLTDADMLRKRAARELACASLARYSAATWDAACWLLPSLPDVARPWPAAATQAPTGVGTSGGGRGGGSSRPSSKQAAWRQLQAGHCMLAVAARCLLPRASCTPASAISTVKHNAVQKDRARMLKNRSWRTFLRANGELGCCGLQSARAGNSGGQILSKCASEGQ